MADIDMNVLGVGGERIAQAGPRLRTEDDGKIFERAICFLYDTPYNQPFPYDEADARALVPRIASLLDLFPSCTHTAARGARYDFTSTDGTQHLSAKTSKKVSGKEAPQVIGQAKPKKFCEILGIPYIDNATLKKYIQENITTVLPYLVEYTFDCPNIYYNKAKNTVQFIVLHTPIDWSEYEYSWTRTYDEWNNSATLKVNGVSLVEFQFHSAGRNNMAVRWCYDTFLTMFRNHLNITVL